MKKGDKVRVTDLEDSNYGCVGYLGRYWPKSIGVLDGWSVYGDLRFPLHNVFKPNQLTVVKEESMARTFRLRHDTPELKRGSILTGARNGFGDYTSDAKNYRHDDQTQLFYTTKTVETMPYWFEEVFPVSPEYATKAELKKLEG